MIVRESIEATELVQLGSLVRATKPFYVERIALRVPVGFKRADTILFSIRNPWVIFSGNVGVFLGRHRFAGKEGKPSSYAFKFWIGGHRIVVASAEAMKALEVLKK